MRERKRERKREGEKERERMKERKEGPAPQPQPHSFHPHPVQVSTFTERARAANLSCVVLSLSLLLSAMFFRMSALLAQASGFDADKRPCFSPTTGECSSATPTKTLFDPKDIIRPGAYQYCYSLVSSTSVFPQWWV